MSDRSLSAPVARQRRQQPISIADRRFPSRTRQGLRPDEVSALHAQQQGMCGICLGPLGNRFTVDHDHTLGTFHGHDPSVGCRACVRGLLCYRCNRGLGTFRDDPERLARAAQWVLRRRPRAAS